MKEKRRENNMENKGLFNFLWIFGAVLLIIAPILVGMLLATLDLGMAISVVLGYIVMFVIDFLILTMLFKVPVPYALVGAAILPFVQSGAVMLATGG